MRIESFGLPGSGKSTLVKSCHEWLTEREFKTFTAPQLDKLDERNPPQGMKNFWSAVRKRQSYRVAEFHDAHPEMVARFKSYYPNKFRNLGLLNLFGSDLIKYRDLKKKIDIFWVDEGFLHFCVHGILRQDAITDKQGELAAFLEEMPLPDVVFHNQITPQQTMDGLRQRMEAAGQPEHRVLRKATDQDGRLEFLTNRNNLINFAAETLAGKGVKLVQQKAHQEIDVMVQFALKTIGVKHDDLL